MKDNRREYFENMFDEDFDNLEKSSRQYRDACTRYICDTETKTDYYKYNWATKQWSKTDNEE